MALAIGSTVCLTLPDASLAGTEGNFNAASEQRLFILQNNARTSEARRPVRRDRVLASVARGRSEDMITRGYFDHTIKGSGRHVWDLLDDMGYCYVRAGENIGWTQYWPDDQAADAVYSLFMNSPAHRADILGRAWDVVGIGAYQGPDTRIMFTVIFVDTCLS